MSVDGEEYANDLYQPDEAEYAMGAEDVICDVAAANKRA